MTQLIELIRNRELKSPGLWIRTADEYVRSIEQCDGVRCLPVDMESALQKASETLVYDSPEMKFLSEVKEVEGVTLPQDSLFTFRHFITTEEKDRDGDILRSSGAELDPEAPLLWQHVHTVPIGKVVTEITPRREGKVEALTTIVAGERSTPLNDLAHDAALLLKNGVLRFSHGFRALEFDELKDEDGRTLGMPGFDIKRFEIMEVSVVSVPANPGARMTDFQRSFESEFFKAQADKEAESHVSTSIRVGCEFPTGDEDTPCSCRSSSSTTDVKSTNEKGRIEPGSLDGSWEWTEKRLARVAEPFLAANGVSLSERFIWIAGTWPDRAVICTEHQQFGHPEEFLYWQAEWEMRDDEPRFKGEPQAVEMSVSLEVIRQRSPHTESKTEFQPADDKSGRRLSRRNRDRLQAVHDDLAELSTMDMARGGQALCERCIRNVGDVLDDDSSSEEASIEPEVIVKEVVKEITKEPTLDEAARLLLTSDDISKKRLVIDLLQTQLDVEESYQIGEEFRSVLAG